MEYVWLIVLWLAFGLLHSIFAATRFKRPFKAAMKGNFKYYRIIYSVFAAISLTAILWYHDSINTAFLWNNSTLEKTVAVIFFVPAIIIMSLCVKKYFMDLSGVDVFVKGRPIQPLHLETGGMHRFVRHPLYFGTLLFVWCIFLWQPSISNFISSTCLTSYTLLGIYFEERKLVKEFGDEYVAYSRRVPMLVPGIG